MIPTIGRIVHYALSEYDAESTNKRRADGQRNLRGIREASTGEQVHIGNDVCEGDVYPMLITRTWGLAPESLVNGQVFLDGNDVLWVTSVGVGAGPRTYAWPLRNP